MSDPETTSIEQTPSAPVADGVSSRKWGCLPKVLIAILLVALIAVGWYFWMNRPIRPVELSVQETQALEEKIGNLQEAAEPEYEKGSKEIVITERELNGLINENTSLGDKLQFKLATGAVHARVESDLDEDLPVVGGKRLKARARFFVKTDEGRPSLVLDDVTVWGASLPNDWLAGMKGKDLLAEIFGSSGAVNGIEELRIENGQLVIRLAE